MTLLRRGSALVMALLLTLALVTYPRRACAMSATMAVVGGAVVVSAALVACGIYPYISEDGQTFGEWGAEKLSDLWAQYVSSFEGGSLPSGGTVQTFQQIKAYVTGQTLVISRSVWTALQDFISWVKSTFSLIDNRDSVGLGVTVSDKYLPFLSDWTSLNDRYLESNGLNVGRGTGSFASRNVYCLSDIDNVMAVICYDSYGYKIVFLSTHGYKVALNYGAGSSVSTVTATNSWPVPSDSPASYSPLYYLYGSHQLSAYNPDCVFLDYYVSGNPSEEFKRAAFDAYFGSSSDVFRGIVADTSTLGALPDMAADADYMGLAVSPGTVEGVAATMTPQAVERIIQQGVTERERPIVTPVDVTIAAGTDIDAATGTLTENPAVVDVGQAVAEYVPAVSELVPDAGFVASVQQYLRTKFPFSLPFDIVDLFSSFVKLPEAPKITVTFHAHPPFLASDYTLTVDLEPWDDVAAVCRQLQAILYLVGFTLAIPKIFLFNNILAGSVI